MNLNENRTLWLLGPAALVIFVVLAILVAVDAWSHGLLWVNLYWLYCTAIALVISLLNLPSRLGLRRTVRKRLSLSFALALAGQLTWALQVYVGWNVVPGPSDILFLLVPIPAIWAAFVAIRNRVSAELEIAAILDTVTMALAMVVVVLAVFGQSTDGFGLIEVAMLLLYPMLFLIPVGAFLITALAVREQPRFFGELAHYARCID